MGSRSGKKRALKRSRARAGQTILNRMAGQYLMAMARRAGAVICPGYTRKIGVNEPAWTTLLWDLRCKGVDEEEIQKQLAALEQHVDCGGKMKPVKIAGAVVPGLIRCGRCGRDGILSKAALPEQDGVTPGVTPEGDAVVSCTTCGDAKVLTYRSREGVEYTEACPDCGEERPSQEFGTPLAPPSTEAETTDPALTPDLPQE